MTGIAVLLGGDRNDHDTYMQAAGHGHCIRAKHLREALDSSTSLHHSLLRYVQAFLKQRRPPWPTVGQRSRTFGALAADG